MQQQDKKVYRAGLVPYIINQDKVIEMMFMVPSDPIYGGSLIEQVVDGETKLVLVSQPQIAKGKVEQDEHHSNTAVREAQEELGLFRGNILGEVHHVGQFLGRTDFHVCKIEAKDMFGEPSYETQEVLWMTLDQFMEDGRPLHKPVVQAAHRLICKIETM